ncbi:MAG: hypothetical protein ACI9H8_001864 [Lysobacterales bacterium]|jgi:hypothetical protein
MSDCRFLPKDARPCVYQFTERFGLGVAYNWQKFDAGVKDTPLNSEFDMTMQGAELSAIFRF